VRGEEDRDATLAEVVDQVWTSRAAGDARPYVHANQAVDDRMRDGLRWWSKPTGQGERMYYSLAGLRGWSERASVGVCQMIRALMPRRALSTRRSYVIVAVCGISVRLR
jgi:hypothetical protein